MGDMNKGHLLPMLITTSAHFAQNRMGPAPRQTVESADTPHRCQWYWVAALTNVRVWSVVSAVVSAVGVLVAIRLVAFNDLQRNEMT